MLCFSSLDRDEVNHGASKALEELASLMPSGAHKLMPDGSIEDVPLRNLWWLTASLSTRRKDPAMALWKM